MHFHRDVMSICETFSRHVLQPSADDVFTGTPPYAFTFGLGGVLLFPLHAGASTLLVEKATPVELADLIDEHGVTVCFTAPTAYKAMLAAGKTVPTLRKAVSAGEHLPKAVWEAFREATGVEIIDGIGATEMLHIFISAAGADIRPGSTGRAVPGYAATIVDDDRPRAAARASPGGWPCGVRPAAATSTTPRRRRTCRTAGTSPATRSLRDDDGYFWYQARSDDMIISSGYNIAAPEVEEALLKHPLVAECAVVGVPDEARGHAGQGVRRERGRGDGRRAAGLREGRDRAVQVPAGDRVRRPSCRRRRPGSCSASGCRAGLGVASAGPPMPDHSPRHLILSLFGLYARDEANWLSVALPDRADGGPRRRRRRDPLVGLAAEEARRARAGQESTGRRATGCRRPRSRCCARATPASGRGRGPSVDDGWLVVVFSVPEAERGKRHELRSLLTRLGFGTAAPGVWVAPGTAYDETLAALDRAGLTSYTELFRGAYLGSGPADVRVGEWWDLPVDRRAVRRVRRPTTAPSTRLRAPRPRARVHGVRPDADRLAPAPLPRPGHPARPAARATGRASGAGELFADLDERLREPAAKHAHARLMAEVGLSSSCRGVEPALLMVSSPCEAEATHVTW